MSQAKIDLAQQEDSSFSLLISGDWLITKKLPSFEDTFLKIQSQPHLSNIALDCSRLGAWDSSLAAFLFRLSKECQRSGIRLVSSGLPEGLLKLLRLAESGMHREKVKSAARLSIIESLGNAVYLAARELKAFLDFLGELTVSFWQLLKGKAFMPKQDFWIKVQFCGLEALPLVSLISFLVGVILAFVAAMQLLLFGAQIFIADIVGIAMVRVMGAIMTAIIMSGRTGASFAAELGLMQVNEEIDALKTMGISAMQFLVLPRVLALVVMMPLLTLYSNLMGILGGYVVGILMFGLNPVEYFTRTQQAVALNNLWVGIVHSFVFGLIVAISGCFKGMRCERNAAGVGKATTQAVVFAITSIVIATAIITYLCHLLKV